MKKLGIITAVVALAVLVALVAWPRGRHELSVRLGFRILPASAEVLAGVSFAVVGSGFQQVTDIQFVPGSATQAVILQKSGTAKVARFSPPGQQPATEASRSSTLFTVKVRTESELGLLGLVFHPKFKTNGLFYVNYNPLEGDLRTRIAEWHVAPNAITTATATERRVLMEVAQPYSNHDAGQLAFGPDGMLYIGFGDGGAGGDPHNHGQDLTTLLGSMLRIDVDRRDPGKEYAVPADNPFVGRKDALPEIWAYGLRNPWRYSFDPKGRLIVADVGQNAWEEIDIVGRGDNLGWKVREGRHCFAPKQSCATQNLVEPIFEYDRIAGQSVTGGYVYTGSSVPSLAGQYLFADFVTGRLWALVLPADARLVPARLLGTFPRTISTFGRDAQGEVYAGDFVGGDILRIVATK